MSLFLLDTDTVSLAQFGHAVLLTRLARQARGDVALSSITFQEQIQGWLARLPRLRTLPQIADWHDRLVHRMFSFWRHFQIVSFTEPAILRFDHLRTLRLNVGLMDLRIAAIAIENGLTVVTRNVRDFGRVPGLATEDWSV